MKTIALFSYYLTAEGASKNVKEILIVSSAEGASEIFETYQLNNK